MRSALRRMNAAVAGRSTRSRMATAIIMEMMRLTALVLYWVIMTTVSMAMPSSAERKSTGPGSAR